MDKQTNVRWPGAFDIRHSAEPPTAPLLFNEHDRLRHQSTIAALSRRWYRHAFEPGCGGGELTTQLAGICDWVSAMDISPNAAARARTRCAHWGNVHIRCADLRSDVPEEPVDLVVFSEIGHYFAAPELVRIVRNLADQMVEGGEFIAVHGLNPSIGHVLQADAVHCQLLANLPLKWVNGQRDGGLRIDTWLLSH
jgi:protein-L-isoaspartate O-methyltransferase